MACTKNPVIDYIDLIITLHTETPEKSISQIMQERGFAAIGADNEYCCPDCGNLSYIGPFIVEGNTVIKILDAAGFILNECCENYDINNVGQSDDFEAIICCNTFSNCAESFNSLMQQYTSSDPLGTFNIYRKGIYEYNTFNNASILCLLNAKITSLAVLDRIALLQAFTTEGGIITYCSDGNVYVGTLESFVNWVELL
jgi:hypothetical protein